LEPDQNLAKGTGNTQADRRSVCLLVIGVVLFSRVLIP
jgi:hypothetical protein